MQLQYRQGQFEFTDYSRTSLIPNRENSGRATLDMPGQGNAGNSRAGQGRTDPKP